MDDKRKGMIFLLIAGGMSVVIILVLLILNLRDSSDDKLADGGEKVESVSLTLPDADEASGAQASKLDAYRNERERNIQDYWDSMAQVEEKEKEVVPDNTGAGDQRPSSSAEFNMPSYEQVFGKKGSELSGSRESEEEKKARKEAAKARRQQEHREASVAAAKEIIDYQNQVASAQQQAADQAALSASEAEPVTPPEPEKIPVERVKVSRGGGVSSMDDDFYQSGSGVSSWDDDFVELDDNYPFKCMFMRQEKLKSGQRVTIRLLEDMVIDGQLVPRNTHLMGVCTISNRVEINVSSLEYRGRILSLDYDAYDNDGTKGIYAPDLQDAETLEQVKGELKRTGMTTMRSNVGRYVNDLLQAGSLVIDGKGNERYVYVPAGYQFYLVKSKK